MKLTKYVIGFKSRAAALFFSAVLIVTFASLPAVGQSSKQKKEQLQTQMKKLQEEIKNIQSALKATSAKKEKSMGEVLSLQAKIASRQKLINNISGQINDLDETIDETQAEIERKVAEVAKMKNEYADMLRKSYQSTTLQNKMAFIFSSTTFYEAFLRYNYLLTIAEYRKNQALTIQKSVAELQIKQQDLQKTKGEKENLLIAQTSQKEELESEKQEKDKAVAILLDKEKRLRKQNDEKNKAVQQLNTRIQAIIEDEIRQARKKAEELAKKNPSTAGTSSKKSDVMAMTPAEFALSRDFTGNRGKLPWPVAKGFVVSQFGRHEHPALKGVMIENNGIDIKTEPSAEARCVFSGTVVSVFFLPTVQNCVIVKHGEYFTVYSGIETVTVKPNQAVTTKQTLGKLHSDKADNLTKVHIEIWKGKEKLDPSMWLAGSLQ